VSDGTVVVKGKQVKAAINEQHPEIATEPWWSVVVAYNCNETSYGDNLNSHAVRGGTMIEQK
jgi:hypothetical protein